MQKLGFILSIFLITLTNLHAFEKSFPYEEGMIEYEIFGTSTGKMVTYFCDYGKKQFSIVDKKDIFGAHKKELILKIEDSYYTIDPQRDEAYQHYRDILDKESYRHTNYKAFDALVSLIDGKESLISSDGEFILYMHKNYFGTDETTAFASFKALKVDRSLFQLPENIIVKEGGETIAIIPTDKQITLKKSYKELISTTL